MFVRNADSKRAIQAILAIGRAYVRLPDIRVERCRDAALRVDAALVGYTAGEAIVALVVVLLKGLGVADWHDVTRLQS